LAYTARIAGPISPICRASRPPIITWCKASRNAIFSRETFAGSGTSHGFSAYGESSAPISICWAPSISRVRIS
jgi:hypothetical protein